MKNRKFMHLSGFPAHRVRSSYMLRRHILYRIRDKFSIKRPLRISIQVMSHSSTYFTSKTQHLVSDPHAPHLQLLNFPKGTMPFPPPVSELTILLHRVTLLLAMTSCVASSTPRPCILSWCSPLSLESSVFPVPIYIYIYTHTHTHTHISCARSIPKPTIPHPPAHVQQFRSLYDFRLISLLARFLLPAESVCRSHTLLYFSWHAVVSQLPCFSLVVPSSLHLGNRLNKTLKHWILLILKFKPGFNVKRISPLTVNSRLYLELRYEFYRRSTLWLKIHYSHLPHFITFIIFIFFISKLSYIRQALSNEKLIPKQWGISVFG